MLRAVDLALNGKGKVSPNPLVGSVIVKNGSIIGEGFHGFYGDSHAEINALNSCTESPKGGTLYCNLEPCSTSYPGKINPPCCEAIIKAEIKRVVIGQIDPNPMVSGAGINILKAAGIGVITGIELEECLKLNTGFNCVMLNNRPFVHLKWAQTLDGRIASKNGESKWITNLDCRIDSHLHRSNSDSILVGTKTLINDNPTLTTRYGFAPSPRPIILSKEITGTSNLEVCKNNPLYLNYSHNTNPPISKILEDIKKEGLNSVFVEGGASLITSFLNSNLWDRITVYTAPRILGEGLNSVGDLNILHPDSSITFSRTEIRIIDNHIIFNGWNKGSFLCLQD